MFNFFVVCRLYKRLAPCSHKDYTPFMPLIFIASWLASDDNRKLDQ